MKSAIKNLEDSVQCSIVTFFSIVNAQSTSCNVYSAKFNWLVLVILFRGALPEGGKSDLMGKTCDTVVAKAENSAYGHILKIKNAKRSGGNSDD